MTKYHGNPSAEGGKVKRIAHRALLTLGFLCLLQSLAFSQPSWPSWTAPTADGADFSSKSLEGKVVVVSIWASWCPSCRRQMPLLSQLQSVFKDSSLQVLSFSFDRSPDQHEQFLESNRVNFPAIYARNGKGLEAVRLLQEKVGSLEAVPTLLVFDRNGRLVHRSVGFSNLPKLESLVTPLLGR